MSSAQELLPLEANVTFSDEIVVRENKDGSVIVMKMDDSDLFYKIDGAAAEIFRDLRKNADLKSSVEKISKKNQVDLNRVHGDTSVFLRKLMDLEFITLE